MAIDQLRRTLETLERRAATQWSEVVPLGELRLEPGGLRVDGSPLEVSRAVRARLRPWAEADGALAAPEGWGGAVRLRVQGGRVVAATPAAARGVDHVSLLRETIAALAELDAEVEIQDLEYDDDLYATLLAPGVAAEVQVGDYVYGGLHLFNSETSDADAEVCMRVYRVACCNGALTDSAAGRRLLLPTWPEPGVDPYADWRARLREVVAQAFSGGCLDEETRRLRETLATMLASPYELLLHLAAQGLIRDDEQARIQRAFDEAGEPSLYGFVNAVTSVAHHLRDRRDWARAADLERLGGELARGDHIPPLGVPAWT